MNNLDWLQLFAEGEAAPAESAPAEATPQPTGEESAPAMTQEAEAFKARLPERAKGTFEKAYKKTHKNVVAEPVEAPQEPQETPQERIPLADLLQDEAYKAEYQDMMNKAFQNRFKKYDGLEERAKRMSKTLETVAQKYNLDPTTDDYLDALEKEVSRDNAYWEQAAMDHGMTPEEYRRQFELKQQAKEAEARQAQMERDEVNRRFNQTLWSYAAETKAKYPTFNLNAEMQDDTFKALVFAYKGDTTQAYESVHREELKQQAIESATNKAKQAVANSIASGQNRPLESGLSNSPAAIAAAPPSFKGMSTKDMKAWFNTHKH